MQKLPVQLIVTISVIILSATGVFLCAAYSLDWTTWPGLGLFFFLIAFTASFPVSDPKGVPVIPITTLVFTAIIVYGSLGGFLVASLGTIVSYILTRDWPLWRVLFNSAQIGLSFFLAGLAYQALGGRVGAPPTFFQVPAILVLVLVDRAANSFFVSFYRSRLKRASLLPTWAGLALELLWSNILSTPLAVLLAVLYLRVHPLILLVFLGALPFQRQALKLYFLRGQLYAQIVDALVIATDVNFPKAKGHSQRVAELSVAIAREMRLADPAVEAIRIGALLHDVGMIGLDDLLERFGDLSPKDARRLEEHVLVGAEIARELPRKDIALMVLSHHERYDGTGYPRRLKGREIPLGARIIAVAETYESMTAGYPPYQNSHSHGEALQFIQDQAGKMFDPEVVQAFVRVCENGAVAWIESPPSLPPSPLEGEGAEEKGPPLAQPASLLAKVHLGGRGGDLTEPEVSPLSIDQSLPTPEERRDL